VLEHVGWAKCVVAAIVIAVGRRARVAVLAPERRLPFRARVIGTGHFRVRHELASQKGLLHSRMIGEVNCGGNSRARAEATMVAVGVVLTARGVSVVGPVPKETSARREIVILVVKVWGAPTGAVTPTVAGLTAHVVVGGIASKTSAGERSVDSCRGGEAVNGGLIASPAVGSTGRVAVQIVVVGTAVTVGAT